jgi:hypothetical protein
MVSNVSASFTRPADTTAYGSGDLVANSTTAGSVTPMSIALPGRTNATVKRVRLVKSGTSATNAAFRVHFYGASPTVANGDNGAWSSSQAATYFGSIDVTVLAFSDGCAAAGAATAGAEVQIVLTSGSTVYCLLEARGAYTPASAEVFTLTVELI